MSTVKEKTRSNPALRPRTKSLHQPPTAAPAPGQSVERLLHELQVHQLELEMQNEALRETQVALEDSRNRYHDLYEFAPVGYLTLNENGLVAHANLTACTLLGIERSKLLHRTFSAFVIGEDQTRWWHHFLDTAAESGRESLEVAMRRGDGATVHVQISFTNVKSAADQLAPAVHITLTDVTARKRAEQESLHRLRRIESLMRYANDCIMIFDTEASIIEVSESCSEVYGYSRDEFQAMHASDLCAEESQENYRQAIQRLMEHGSLSFQTSHRRKDGSSFPIEVGAAMIEIDGTRYFQTIIRDITDNVRRKAAMEAGLAAAANRLNRLSRHLVEAQEDARRRLSAELHDHTSPNLAAIKINLGLLAAGLMPNCSGKCADRLADTQALVEDTDVNIREISADLRSPVLDYAGLPAALDAYALRYASRVGIAVQVDCSSPDTRLEPALESLLFRIFQEALTNCLKHAQASMVNVTIDLDTQPIKLVIADNGVGFDPGLICKDGEDAGIGLINMREMAEFAGGELSIFSHPGKGTRIEARIKK